MFQLLKLRQAWLGWQWMHYAVVGVVAFMTCSEVYTRYENRLTTVQSVDIANMEEDIQEFNTMAEQLGQLEELPPVARQWAYAEAVTSNFNLNLRPVSKSKETYQGPLASWSGVLDGPTGQVLAAAKRIQETVPAYLYGFQITGNRATITFSVLGSE